MYNPVIRWSKSPNSPAVTRYDVAWSLNGAPAGAISVSSGPAPDSAGYSTLWTAANPTTTLKGNDVVGASLTAFDATDNLSSTPVVPATVTVPATPPQSPANVVLSLT